MRLTRSHSVGVAASRHRRLPHLDSVSDSVSQSASMKSDQLKRLTPTITTTIINEALPILRNGEPHPQPYYVTSTLRLRIPSERPPWISSEPSSTTSSPSLSPSQMEIVDKWVRTTVLPSEQLLVAQEVLLTKLWDDAMRLQRDERKRLERQYEKTKLPSLVSQLLSSNARKAPLAKSARLLLSHPYGLLLLHLHAVMAKTARMDNYVLRTLQDTVISRVAVRSVLEESIKFMEDAMADDHNNDNNDNNNGNGNKKG